MIVTTYRIPYEFGDTIKIKPIADVHWGNTYCDERAFREYLADSDDQTYFFSIGDNLDLVIAKDVRRYMKHSDATKTDATVDEQINSFVKELVPYKDRLIGIGSGNHEKAILKYCATDPTQRMCEILDCVNLGYSGLIRLVLHEDNKRVRTIIIHWHHGWGGGSRMAGSDVTKYSHDVKHWAADVFFYGHVHRRQSDIMPRMGLSGEKLINKDKPLGICGSFLKTYSLTADSTYSEERGYPPVSVGGLVLHIKPLRSWVKMWIEK